MHMILTRGAWTCIHGCGYPDVCGWCHKGTAANPKDSYIGAAPTNLPPTDEKEKQTCH